MQAIMLDFDGVIVQSMNLKADAFAKLFEKFGTATVRKVVKHHLENGSVTRYEKIRYYYSEFLNREIADEELNKIADEFSSIVLEKIIALPFVDGVIDFLEQNCKTVDIYIVSATPQFEMNIIVKKKNISKYFKDTYGLGGAFETKIDIFNKIIEENRYDKESVVYVGDCLSDYNDAKEVGIAFVGCIKGKSPFPKGTKTISDFVRYDHVF